MSRVYQREDTWYIDFRMNGKRYRESAGQAASRDDALQVMADRRKAVRQEHIYGAEPKKITFAAFADDFLKTDSPDKKSKDRDRSVLEMLTVQWKGRKLADITTKMIEDYKAMRLNVAKRTPATVVREIQIIKRLFKKARGWKFLRENPGEYVERPRVRNNRVRFLEQNELARLFGYLSEWLRKIATFARFTGARRGEILNLAWNDVDLKRETMTYRDTKNGETVTVPMNRTVKALLSSLPRPLDRTQLVFQLENTPRSWMQIRRGWAEACAKAKLTDFHFHDLRHQAATDLRHAGVDLGDVKEFLRHKSMVMTLRYAHIRDEKKRAAACVLDTFAAPIPKGTKAGTN